MQRRMAFAAAGLLALGFCFTVSTPAAAQGNAPVTPNQLRACRSEADRRLSEYSYEQIEVTPESRDQNVANIRWQAGTEGGRCTVATNGRVLAFTRDKNFGGDNVSPGYGNTGSTTRITCESKRTDRMECKIPAGARIQLARQLSDNPCRLNDTYGQGQGYLWVAEGCRGEFDVTMPGPIGGNPPPATRITCASPINGRQECKIPSGTEARFVGQAGSLPCRPNDTYGWKQGYVWVQRGCQAIFELTGGFSGGNGGSNTTRLVCESQGAARQQCPIAGATSVRLIRQISTTPCRLNQSFGTGFGHIWVSNGCRGEFEVTVAGSPGGPGNGGGNATVRLTCMSQSAARQQCSVAGASSVRLIKQYSTNPCRLNETFGTGFGHIWVSNGCRGEFEVTVAGGPGTGYPSPGTGLPTRVTCESSNGQRNECRIGSGAQVQLVRQLSTTACVRNNTWGTGYGVLWVDKGCRGEFEVK